MDEFSAMLRRERAIRALWPLFFVSGATSLTYQTLWARQLHLVFGTSTMAIATVLTAFMAGLALGGALMGRWADAVRRPVRVYALLEVGIGLYALVFPWLLGLLSPIYLEFYRSVEPPVWLFALVQLLLVGLALLLPTALMGATLPLLARFAGDKLGAAGDRVGTLYGVNTLGAVFGTLLCGFFLLPMMGLWVTTFLAAGANILLGGVAWLVDFEGGEASEVAPAPSLALTLPATLGPVAVALALAGFASLVYEVAWFRLLTLLLGPSAYAFSLMLLAFLVGIGLGGLGGGRLADWLQARHGLRGVLVALAMIEVGVALTSFVAMYGFQFLPYTYVVLWDTLGAQEGVGRVWLLSLVLAGLTMTPPAVLMGAAFPVAARAVMVEEGALGRVVGRAYAANTVGAVVGAAVAGFVLLPGLGVQGAIFAAAASNLVAAVVLLRSAGGGGHWRVALLGAVVPLGFVVARPPWDELLMTAGVYHYVDDFSDRSWDGFKNFAVDGYDLLYYREGLTSVVTVARNRATNQLWLANNGKVDASSAADMPTQVLCALLPLQFVEEPEDVLVIGLASGVTAGSLQPVTGIERLDIVEIEPAITEAARFFDPWNHRILDDPRARLIANDGRNHVLLAAPGTYDVVVSEPSNPWISGVSNLFTREFFELGKSRLKPGGVWSQWVQLYKMDDADVAALLGTFADVFPYVLVYSTIEDADLVLVGSDSPIRPEQRLGNALLERWPGTRVDLAQVGVSDGLDLVAFFIMDQDEIQRLSAGVVRNTDDNMRIEYSAPLHLHEVTAEDNMRLLEPHSQLPLDGVRDAEVWYDLALRYREHSQIRRSNLALVEALRMSEPGSELRAELLDLATRWETEAL